MYIKLNLIPIILKLLLKQLICALGCIFFILTFPAMIDSGIGEIIYSIFSIIVFFDILYSTCWNLGNKHRRDVNIYNRKQQYQSYRARLLLLVGLYNRPLHQCTYNKLGEI